MQSWAGVGLMALLLAAGCASQKNPVGAAAANSENSPAPIKFSIAAERVVYNSLGQPVSFACPQFIAANIVYDNSGLPVSLRLVKTFGDQGMRTLALTCSNSRVMLPAEKIPRPEYAVMFACNDLNKITGIRLYFTRQGAVSQVYLLFGGRRMLCNSLTNLSPSGTITIVNGQTVTP